MEHWSSAAARILSTLLARSSKDYRLQTDGKDSQLCCAVSWLAQPAKQKEKRVQEILLSFSLDSVWKSVNLRMPKWEHCSAVKFEKSPKSKKKITDEFQIFQRRILNWVIIEFYEWVKEIILKSDQTKMALANSRSTIELNCDWSFTK